MWSTSPHLQLVCHVVMAYDVHIVLSEILFVYTLLRSKREYIIDILMIFFTVLLVSNFFLLCFFSIIAETFDPGASIRCKRDQIVSKKVLLIH